MVVRIARLTLGMMPALLVVMIALVPLHALALSPVNTADGEGAVHGYDPVAYFTEGKPVKGKSQYHYTWKDATWHFADEANLEAFQKEPEKYAPQYGGYCAYAVSQGGTADIDPEAWKIVDGKLYLNLSKRVQRIWEKDIPSYIAQADSNWPKVVQ